MMQCTACFPSLRNLLLRTGSVFASSKIGITFNRFASHQLSYLRSPNYSDYEYADMDWDSIGYELMPTDYMYIAKCSKGKNFGQGQLNRLGNIELNPSAGVLNYGQGLIEGAKACRKEDGRVLLFHPEQNAIRMQIGAERMCMESPSIDQFVYALKQTVMANKRWVPPPGKGSLYLRPLLLGTGPVLGVAPAPEYTYLVFASPVGNYFREGSAPLNLYVEEDFDRASRRGTGNVKAISNYAPVMLAQIKAKKRGFSDVLYLDSVTKENLEEVSASNIFIAKGKCISTPATNGSILPGITRKSVIEIARDHGYQVEERAVSVNELIEAEEVFCTGTAVGVAAVRSITYRDTSHLFIEEMYQVQFASMQIPKTPKATVRLEALKFLHLALNAPSFACNSLTINFNFYCHGFSHLQLAANGFTLAGQFQQYIFRMEYKTGSGSICEELNNAISGIQTGTIEDRKGWIVEVD